MSQEIKLGNYACHKVETLLRDRSTVLGIVYHNSIGGEFPYVFNGSAYRENGEADFNVSGSSKDIVQIHKLSRCEDDLGGIVQFAPHIDLAVFNEGDEVYLEIESNSKTFGVIGEFTANNGRKISLSENVQAYCRLDGSKGLGSPIVAIYGPGAYRLDLAPAPDPAIISALNTLSSLSPDQLSQVLNHFNQQ